MTQFPLNRGMFIHPRETPHSAWLGHIPFAGWLIQAIEPSLFVELGTHQGASYLAFCQTVQEIGLNTKCYAVDTWTGDEHSGRYGDEVFLRLLDYHQRNYAEFSRLLKMTFDEAAQYFDDGSIDLLHIDGLHSYEAVKHDFETWLPKLSRKGVVLFHDINVRERGFGVWKLWSELRDTYPSFEFSHTHGLGVLLVGRESPSALKELCEQPGDDVAVEVNRLFDHLGRLIAAHVDIGGLAGLQGQLQAQIVSLEAALKEREAELDQRAQHNETQRVAESEHEGRLLTLTQALVVAEEAAKTSRDLIDRCGQDIADRDRQIALGSSEVEGLRHQKVELEAGNARLQQGIAQLRQEITERDQRLASQQAEIEQLHRARMVADAEAAAILSSSSWRITAPLRAISHYVRGIGKKANE